MTSKDLRGVFSGVQGIDVVFREIEGIEDRKVSAKR